MQYQLRSQQWHKMVVKNTARGGKNNSPAPVSVPACVLAQDKKGKLSSANSLWVLAALRYCMGFLSIL